MTAHRPRPHRVPPIRVSAHTATTATGGGVAELRAALDAHRSGLLPNDFSHQSLGTWIGRVSGAEAVTLPSGLASWDCRNNRLAWLGLQADGFLDAARTARDRHGAQRVAVVIGTSTSSIGETEDEYRKLGPNESLPAHLNPRVHTAHSLGAFVQAALGLEGPCFTLSTACSSSAKVFASAERLIRLGLVDAAIVGGVDSLCGSALFGFNSLELVSR